MKPSGRTVDGMAALQLMMVESRNAFAKVRDYSGHLIRQERVKGVLQAEQTMEFRARTQPQCVNLKWIAPANEVGREVSVIAGKYAGKVRLKPAGSYGALSWVTVEPTDGRLMSDARLPVTGLGIGAVVDRLERMIMIEQRLRNPVFVSVSEYMFAGRPVTRFEIYTQQPHALRYAYRTVVYIDPETKLPVRFEAYDQPVAGGDPQGDLLEVQSLVNLRFNQGLSEAMFER